MYYIVQLDDTLSSISLKFNITIQSILDANIICSQVSFGEILLLTDYNLKDLDIPKSGAGPYYIIKPGDTLECISIEIGVPVYTLTKINNLQNSDILNVGSELILSSYFNTPDELKQLWERIPDENCMIYGMSSYGNYYLNTFQWLAFGEKSIKPLLELLENPCEEVKYYAIESLGRLALNGEGVIKSLTSFISRNDYLSEIAKLAIKKIQLRTLGLNRIHIITQESTLWTSGHSSQVPIGSELVVLKWFIPEPQIEGSRGGYLICDYVLIVNTGQIGLLPRIGLGAITFI